MWGIHQAAAPAKVGSRLSRELGSQGLLIPTAGAPRGGAQPVRGGRGHVGGTSEQFPTLPRFPHPKPSKKQFKGRKSAPCPGRCRGAGPSQAPAVPSRRPLRDQNPAICERKALLYFRLILSLGKAFPLVLARRNTEHSAKFEFQITNMFWYKYVPNPARGMLILKHFLLFT